MSIGTERLWNWFGLSYASFLILPRAGMHQMPDDWQQRMAELLEEWDETVKKQPDISFIVQGRKNGKLCSVPDWIKNYRRPDQAAWDNFFGRARHCSYPDCNCPFDMGPDNLCLRNFPMQSK